MTEKPDCIFCGIVDRHAGSDIVWEDELVLAFMDINPVTDGHVLVIPKVHSVGLTDIAPKTAGRMMTVAQRLAQAMKDSDLRCDGVNLFFADGEAAFQEVFHSHLHVFPRFPNDGFTIGAHWDGRSNESLTASALAIRAVLDRDGGVLELTGRGDENRPERDVPPRPRSGHSTSPPRPAGPPAGRGLAANPRP